MPASTVYSRVKKADVNILRCFDEIQLETIDSCYRCNQVKSNERLIYNRNQSNLTSRGCEANKIAIRKSTFISSSKVIKTLPVFAVISSGHSHLKRIGGVRGALKKRRYLDEYESDLISVMSSSGTAQHMICFIFIFKYRSTAQQSWTFILERRLNCGLSNHKFQHYARSRRLQLNICYIHDLRSGGDGSAKQTWITMPHLMRPSAESIH